tara:strand:+ start:3064 stop:3831 length:768 start_codon:yes stop_codon:yes gene_type:complete
MGKGTEEVWEKIVSDLNLENHNFDNRPFEVPHSRIKEIVSPLTEISNESKEIRLLGSQVTREKRPKYFKENNLFLLPSSNRSWYFLQGDGYFDIPELSNIISVKQSPNKVTFDSLSGDSEARYINEAFAKGIISDFCKDTELKMTLMGRRYASLNFNAYNQKISCDGVQIEIDAGYESKQQIVFLEAKASVPTNETIRQLYFPFKFLKGLSKKKIRCLFLVVYQKENFVILYEYGFKYPNIYESIYKIKEEKYLL